MRAPRAPINPPGKPTVFPGPCIPISPTLLSPREAELGRRKLQIPTVELQIPQHRVRLTSECCQIWTPTQTKSIGTCTLYLSPVIHQVSRSWAMVCSECAGKLRRLWQGVGSQCQPLHRSGGPRCQEQWLGRGHGSWTQLPWGASLSAALSKFPPTESDPLGNTQPCFKSPKPGQSTDTGTKI